VFSVFHTAKLVNNNVGDCSRPKHYNFLHLFIFGIESSFTHWCNRMFEYGFEEGIDFILLKNEYKISKSNLPL